MKDTVERALKSLLKSELLAPLSAAEQEAALAQAGALSLARGDVLFSPGERAECFYLLAAGRLRVYRETASGQEEAACFTAGDLIGEFDFARRASHDAYADAVEPCSLCAFPRPGLSLEDAARACPALASKILLNAVVMITNRIAGTRRLLLENMSWVRELYRNAYEDPGTGLWKQSFLEDDISRVLESPTTLIMLKPDRFKILDDTRGHEAGDKAMLNIGLLLRRQVQMLGRGWALRFKSNETGILVNRCGPDEGALLAQRVASEVAALPALPPQGALAAFPFSGSIAWGVWPDDAPAEAGAWDGFFAAVYALLLGVWREGGNRVVRLGEAL
ncbi:MAG: cyclic nucleotide-binding domain-containing protein [Treponema sp.]|jgi:GGDEF domain-containing protein|nr:cyclic nucleotide-binding domain-containing protein [Treponema sp.]